MISELKTILLALTPINELRGTIPVAISLWQISPLKAFFLACLGNILPIFFLLWFLRRLVNLLMAKNIYFNKFFNWLFIRTRQRFYKKHALYGDLALTLFVAIPLPLTGAWTGAVAAFLFGIPYWRSLGLIFVGVVIAGAIVTLSTLGIISIL